MKRLRFSWVIPNKLAGCAGPRDSDDLRFLKRNGVALLVRLAEEHIAQVTTEQVVRSGLMDLHEPISDFTGPPQEIIAKIVSQVNNTIEIGESVAISCDAGIGRTGMVLTCILISRCFTIERAIDIVQRRRKQPRACETLSQYQTILGYARSIGKE